MSETISVVGVVSDTTSVLVPTILKTALEEQSSNTSNGQTVVVYDNETSDANHADRVTITMRRSAPSRGNPAYTDWSVEHVTSIKVDNSVDTISDVYYPARVKLSGRFPDVGLTAAQLLAHIGTVYGLIIPSASSGVPATTLANKILRANPVGWY